MRPTSDVFVAKDFKKWGIKQEGVSYSFQWTYSCMFTLSEHTSFLKSSSFENLKGKKADRKQNTSQVSACVCQVVCVCVCVSLSVSYLAFI